MKTFLQIYRFLGGVYFAILLIASVALFVIIGTFIEASTQSHLFASHFTYGSPLFAALLWGFFINILFSALRRWPFKIKHIPFLITHFGLLLILAGGLVKHYFGIQGVMSLTEGSGSQEIFETDSYAIHVEKYQSPERNYFPLKPTIKGTFHSHVAETTDGLRLRLIDYIPHSTEKMAGWFKGDYAFIKGLNPLPIHAFDDKQEAKELPLSGRIHYQGDWNIYAFRTANVPILINKLYNQECSMRFIDRTSNAVIAELPIEETYQYVKLDGSSHLEVKTQQHLNFSEINGFDNPCLEIIFKDGLNKQKMSIPLDGDRALINENLSTPYLGSLPISVEIKKIPTIAFIGDDEENIHVFVFDRYGQVWVSNPYKNDPLNLVIAYANGFGGYAIQAELPLEHTFSRETSEAAVNARIVMQLKQALLEKVEFSPPLQLLQHVCDQAHISFVDTCLDFLTFWNGTHSWVYPGQPKLTPSLAKVFNEFDWTKVSSAEKEASFWTFQIFEHLNPGLQQGQDLLSLLKEKQWPLLQPFEEQYKKHGPFTVEETTAYLTLLTQQIYAAAQQSKESKLYPGITPILTTEENAACFSAYLRAYGIHLNTISPTISRDDIIAFAHQSNNIAHFILETSIHPIQKAAQPLTKLEENSPLAVMQAIKGNHAQIITLTYDRNGSGLKWPVLNGEYTLRFQPLVHEIPYRIRLRQARHIPYANSSQPFSYESDLIITDRRTGKTIEKTISMNHVHETQDGYRFYLSSIAPPGEGNVKRILIVVNHHPAKYWLIYPGAIILSLGILLLFYLRPYK